MNNGITLTSGNITAHNIAVGEKSRIENNYTNSNPTNDIVNAIKAIKELTSESTNKEQVLTACEAIEKENKKPTPDFNLIKNWLSIIPALIPTIPAAIEIVKDVYALLK